MLWVRAQTVAGNSAHGMSEDETCGVNLGTGQPAGEICSIADHFVAGFAPDPKTTFSHYIELPTFLPNPWWTYCARCIDELLMPGDIVSNPVRFLTIDASYNAVQWTANGAIDTINFLSDTLRRSFGDASRLWIGAGEPTALPSTRDAPRAMLISADGTSVLGSLAQTRSGFGLRSAAYSSRTSARSQFAAAYSRSNEAVYVAGGLNSRGLAAGDVMTFAAGRWTRVALQDVSLTPRNVKAAIYSTRDAMLWVIDDLGRAGLAVKRIDPRTGAITSFTGLTALRGLAEVYLATLEDGRVVLAGNTSAGHRTVVLEVVRSRLGSLLRVAGQLESSGRMVMAPAVAGERIHVALESTRGSEVAIVPAAHALRELGL